MSTIPHIRFYDGREAPCLGLGVWQVTDDEAVDVVGQALEMGYRSIDTAAIYDNEGGVGRAIAHSGLPREDLFITTKVWNTDHGHDAARTAFMSSLEKLGLDHVDLYLIHWPVPKTDLYIPTWEALIQLRDEGLAKSIGVCNFNRDHLEHLLDATGVMPVLNQIELHPLFQQPALRSFHAENGILTQAWSPLGQGRLLEHPLLLALAAKHARSAAQIILRWHLQLGNMVIPKSVTRARQAENMAVFDFELGEDDMQAIATLHTADGRLGPDPQRFRLPHH
ncbi:MAG: aldo/keto reductase [Castellaniella sp.]